MKKIIMVFFVVVMLVGNVFVGDTLAYTAPYNAGETTIFSVEMYETYNLTTETLTNRIGKIIIEKVIGKVLDNEGNGKILNTYDSYYNYINYRYVEGFEINDIIVTYLIYNPFNNYEDDIICRYDFILR